MQVLHEPDQAACVPRIPHGVDSGIRNHALHGLFDMRRRIATRFVDGVAERASSRPWSRLALAEDALHEAFREGLRRPRVSGGPAEGPAAAFALLITGCCTNWRRAGVDIATTAKLAGHADISNTEHYLGDITPEEIARVPDAFGRILGRRAI